MGRHSLAQGQGRWDCTLPGCPCVGHSPLTLSSPSCKSWKVFEQSSVPVGLGLVRMKEQLESGVGREENRSKHLGRAGAEVRPRGGGEACRWARAEGEERREAVPGGALSQPGHRLRGTHGRLAGPSRGQRK